MISGKQHKANIQNSKLGGVKTPEGKIVSKFNAQKHAILRQTITEYEEEINDYVLIQLIQQLAPVGIIEEILVERIAVSYVKLYRVARAENEYFKERRNPAVYRTVYHREFENTRIIPFPVYEEKIIVKEAYESQIKSGDIEKITDIYSRYEVTLENRLYKALHHLERLQRMRKGEKVSAPLAFDIGIEKMGSFGENI